VSDDGVGTLPQLSFKSKSDGSVLRTADILGCTITQPKKARKGAEHAFRLDLESKDSKGDTKHVLAFASDAELAQWTEYLEECAAVEMT